MAQNEAPTIVSPKETARLKVRRFVTQVAAIYIFVGAAALAGVAFIPGMQIETLEQARDGYMMAAPMAGVVIGWWFESG